MQYTITDPSLSDTIAGAQNELGDPVRAYENSNESSTYEISRGASAYAITSQEAFARSK
jgi:hypothetical protein